MRDSPAAYNPLKEKKQTVKIVLSQHPLRVVLIIFLALGMFIMGAVASGVVEDIAATWFREQATPFLLRQSRISNGWLIAFLLASVVFLTLFSMLAVRHYKRARQLSAQVERLTTDLSARDGEIENLHGVLDNQNRLLDRFQRDRDSRDQTVEQLSAARDREYKILAILNEALILMLHSVLNSDDTPASARRRFFATFKLNVPHFFARPEDIFNVCILEPKGNYLYFSSYSTRGLPKEVASTARYYIGHDILRRHESGIEGELYGQMRSDDSNLATLEPVIVHIQDRREDKAPDYDNYVGFYGRAGLTVPFASYLIVPLGHQRGLLRIESLAIDTFGPSQYMPLKQMARLLELAFSMASISGLKQGEESDE